MDSAYASTDGRKVVYSSLNPVKLLRNANVFTYIVLGVLVVLISVITLIIWRIIRKIKRKKQAQQAA